MINMHFDSLYISVGIVDMLMAAVWFLVGFYFGHVVFEPKPPRDKSEQSE